MDSLTSSRMATWFFKTCFFIVLVLPIFVVQPYLYPGDWGQAMVFRAIVTFMIVAFLFQLLRRGLLLPAKFLNPMIWLLVALAGIFIVATIFSVSPQMSLFGSPLRSGGLISYLCYIAFAVLAFFTLQEKDWKQIWNFAFVVGTVVAAIACIQFFGLFSSHFTTVNNRPPSTLGNPIFLATYLSLLLFPVISFLIKERVWYKKILYGVLALLFVGVVALTATRAVFLGIAIGGIYYALFYNKKFLILKIIGAGLVVALFCALLFATLTGNLPGAVKNTSAVNSIISRFSLQSIAGNDRFSTWVIAEKAFMSRPLLGWGPENFYTAFNAFYNPKTIPYDSSSPKADWWDRAHNLVLDTGIQTGVGGIVLLFSLLGFSWYKLQQTKRVKPEYYSMLHAVQATLIAYVVENFFGFDSMATYVIFFLLLGYTMHLVYGEPLQSLVRIKSKKALASVGLVIVSCLAIVFLWEGVLVPFMVNAQVVAAQSLAEGKQCDKALTMLDETLKSRSFLDADMRSQYAGVLTTCDQFYPQNDRAYAERGMQILKEAAALQPKDPRTWLFLGGFTTIAADRESDSATKAKLIKEADAYIRKANELAPNRQETMLAHARLDLAAGDYKAMAQDAQVCINLNSSLGECYFELAVADIYQADMAKGKEALVQAQEKKYNVYVPPSFNVLAGAYAFVKDYQDLALLYQQAILINPVEAQYHASLAFVYRELGEYQKARQEVKRFLELAPDQKNIANEFLKTLP